MSMFCFQCEQTASCKGCTVKGVCGKLPSTSALQDEIVQTVKEMAVCNHALRQNGKKDTAADRLTLELLFATVTNVNFDDNRLSELLRQAQELRSRLQHETGAALPPKILRETLNEDIHSLRELLLYGIKGTAAYACHALILGKEDDAVYAFFAKALAVLAQNMAAADELLALNKECGQINFKAMELLDAGNTEHFGHPVPAAVRITPKAGKAILVSGHDLLDLEELLIQTGGKGINVYTHGEMLPAHGYPQLKKYPHLAGNYGSAWQNQEKEFAVFPGAILMTTNCIQNPISYAHRIFTTGCVAWNGVKHIPDRISGKPKDFTPVIEAALQESGFAADEQEQTVLTGFGHHAVLGIADKVIAAVKAGKIRHFFLIGGCDGAKSGRNYYTELAEKIPQDCVILTLACGKYRFHKHSFGSIDIDETTALPRLLDIGQCNDAYSAIRIAAALAEAFDTDVNGLPLSLILSWYEQKAVCILLTLLSLGIKNIRLGPSLPAFLSTNILNILVDTFGIAPITSPDEDLKQILG